MMLGSSGEAGVLVVSPVRLSAPPYSDSRNPFRRSIDPFVSVPHNRTTTSTGGGAVSGTSRKIGSCSPTGNLHVGLVADPGRSYVRLAGMRMLHPGADSGHQIKRFGSHGACRLGGIRFSGEGALTLLNLEAGGLLGRHPAPTAQLFCITRGTGWVAGDDERGCR